MVKTPTASDADAQDAREQQVASSSTSPASTTTSEDTAAGATTRYGFSTPGLDFTDGEADHRQDLKDAEGNGALVRDGVPAGTEMVEDPNRPEHDPPVGQMWVQKLPGES